MALAGSQPQSVEAQTQAKAQARLSDQMALFQENKGQWDSRARFLARSPGANVWLTAKGFVFDYYRQRIVNGQEGFDGHAVGMEFVGASATPKFAGIGQAHTISDFIDLEKGKTKGVASYKSAIAKGVYPGIDVKSYYDGASPRYDIIVAPGKDPSVVAFDLKGVSGVSVDKKGDLVYSTSIGDRKHTGLFAYQVKNGKREAVPVSYKITGKNRVSFELGAYDKSRQLVIDPLIYGSYYGGDGHHDDVRAAVTDERGGVYLTGATRSSAFPAIYGPYGFSLKGGWDAFISKFQDDAYSHDYSALITGSGTDVGMKLAVDQFGDVWVAGKTTSFDFPAPRTWKRYTIKKVAAGAAPNAWILEIGTPGTYNYFRQKLPYAASSRKILELIALNSPGIQQMVDEGNLVITGESPGSSAAGIMIKFRVPYQLPISVRDAVVSEPTGYRLATADIGLFLMRFKQSRDTVLDPFENGLTQGYVVDADETIHLVNLAIVPRESPDPAVPVRLVLAGRTLSNIEDIPGTRVGGGYFLTYDYRNGQFTPVAATSQYIGDAVADITGMALDDQGSIYVSGTVFASGNSDTAIDPNPVFRTTPGVYAGGRLSRNTDLYARKYDRFGNVVYSCLIGGNADEQSAGYWDKRTVVSGQRELEVIGNSIAVDNQRNAYVYGVTTSFNYPRTRGVFGETFNATQTQVVVTKLDPTASNLLYSTNLRTTGGYVRPFGISVDQRGAVYLTGQVGLLSEFIWTGNPPDPVQPTGQVSLGTIPVTSDAIRGTFTSPANPNLHARDSYLLVLNPSATNLVYGTYIGGNLEDMIYAPHTNRFGDLWLTGWTQQSRYFTRTSSTGTVTEYRDQGGLVSGFITPLAFKASVDPSLRATGGYAYGIDQPMPSVSPQTITIQEAIDGYVLKFRLGLPIIQNFTLNPTILAGGDPRTTTNPAPPSTTATVTLDQAAPAGGINIRLSVSNPEVASFDPRNSVSFIDVPIAGGATTASALVYSRKVSTRTTVQVRAEYEGNFRILSLTIEPWLQKLTFTPGTTAGGNTVTGRITLYQAVPADVFVSVTSDNTNDPIVQPGLIRVPAGQETVTFPVETKGVSARTTVRMTASFLGAKQSTDLTLEPASLKELVLAPESTADFSEVKATLRLDGKAASTPIYAKVTVNAAGYQILPKLPNSPAGVVRIPAGQSEVTFRVLVPFESVSIDRTVTAVRSDVAGVPLTPQQKVEATLLVNPMTVKSVTLNPTTVAGGHSSTATVTLNATAPDSGVVIYLSSNNENATVPASITINAGVQQATFEVKTKRVLKVVSPIIKASRSKEGTTPVDPNAKTATLQVVPITITGLSFSPTSIVGGSDSTGTVTISNPAPAGGLKLYVTQEPVVAGMPNGLIAQFAVDVPEGATTANFTVTGRKLFRTVTTKVILSRVNGDVPADADPAVVRSANVEVRAHLIQNLVMNPNPVNSGEKTVGTVTLTEDAPAGGLTIFLSSNSTNATVPSNVLVPPGARTATFTVSTVKLLENATATITASRVVGDLPSYADPAAKRSTVLNIVTQTIASLTFEDNPVNGGYSTKGTVTLSMPAPAGGVNVYLFSNNGMAAQVPVSVRVAAGTSSATFTVKTSLVLTDTDVRIKAARNESGGAPGSVLETVLKVKALNVASVELVKPSLFGGETTRAVVTLSYPAPSTGVTLYLFSSNPAVAAISGTTLEIPSGALRGNFGITTSLVTKVENVTIKATRNSTGAAPGSVGSAVLTVNPHGISAISLDPNPVLGGFGVKGTVNLSHVAPVGGVRVYLYSGNAAVTVPASVLVAAGATSASFNATTKMVLSDTNVTITASRSSTNPPSGTVDPSTVRTATLRVLAQSLVNLTLVPNPVQGGQTSTGTVTMSSAAPTGGAVIYLSSSNTGAATVPASVTIPAGGTTATFTVTSKIVALDQQTTITASRSQSAPAGPITRSVNLTVKGLQLMTIDFDPSVVRGTENTTLVITLNQPVPGSEGVRISLTATDPDLLVLPSTVTVQPGARTVRVTIPTNRVARDLTTEVTATLNGSSKTTILKVVR